MFFTCQFYPQNRWKSQYYSKPANPRVTRPIFLDSAYPCASKLLLSEFLKKCLLFLHFYIVIRFFWRNRVCKSSARDLDYSDKTDDKSVYLICTVIICFITAVLVSRRTFAHPVRQIPKPLFAVYCQLIFIILLL